MASAACRLCLRRCSSYVDVFTTEYSSNMKLRNLIHQLFSFWVTSADVSTVICIKCNKLLKDFHELLNTVKNTQSKLYNENKKNNILLDYMSDEDCSNIFIEKSAVFIKDNQLQNDSNGDVDKFVEHVLSENIVNQYCEIKLENIEVMEGVGSDHSSDFKNTVDEATVRRSIKLKKNGKKLDLRPNEKEINLSDLVDGNKLINNCGTSSIDVDEQSERSNNQYLDLINIGSQSAEFCSNDMQNIDTREINEQTENNKKIEEEYSNNSKKNKSDIEKSSNENLVSVLNTERTLSVSDFPSELIKDGRLTVKGSVLYELINKFYNINCDLCHENPRFKNLTKMMKHYDVKHGIKGYITCCNTRFYQHRSIYMHMAKHLQPSAFECPICKKTVSRPHSLKVHIQTHLPTEERPLKCDQCDKRFVHLEGLTNHKQTHIPVEKRDTYTCKICGKIFTLAPSLSTHMRAVHSSMKYLCPYCGRGFRRKTEMKFHMLTHDTTGENRVQCQHCGFICKNQPTLKTHLKLHSNERIHCTLCEFTTHRRQQLNVHMRVKHSDEKPFVCLVCGKQFKLKCVLMTHMAQHEDGKKYVCNFCQKTFTSPGNYYTHRKRKHAEQLQVEKLKKYKERYQEIQTSEIKAETKTEDKAQEYEMAREYLQKISSQTVNRKNSL